MRGGITNSGYDVLQERTKERGKKDRCRKSEVKKKKREKVVNEKKKEGK